MAQPFIGSRITLISVSQIRYEGVLNAVDQQEATVSLQDVQMFGTEGRRGSNEIPPNNKTYSFIKFRASDILELQVVAEPDPPAFTDPAILSATEAPSVPLAPTSSGPPGMAVPTTQPRQIQQRAPQQQQQQQQQQPPLLMPRQQQQQHQNDTDIDIEPTIPAKPKVTKIDVGKPTWGGNAAKSMSTQLRPKLNNNNNNNNRRNNQNNNRNQRQNNYNNNNNNNNNNNRSNNNRSNNNRRQQNNYQSNQQPNQQQQQPQKTQQQPRRSNPPQQRQRQPPRYNAGSGADLLTRDSKRGGQIQEGGIDNKTIQETNFNFQAGVDKFNELKVTEAEASVDNDAALYTKGNTMDSFFDSLSSGKDKSERSSDRNRMSREEQKKKNLDTFGVEGLQRDRNNNRRRNNRNYNNNNRRNNTNNNRRNNNNGQQQTSSTTQ